MSIPFATTASKIPDPECRTLPVRELMNSLAEHEHLYENIANYPHAGIFQRFTKEWSLCLSYLESEVHQCFLEALGFCRAGEAHGDGGTEKKLRGDLAKKMNSLFEALERHARGVQYASKMVRAPSPRALFMNFYRAHLKFDGSMKAPNGEDTSVYEPEGNPVPSDVLALNGIELHPIEGFLVHVLMNPFIYCICRPFRKVANKIKGGGDSKPIVDQKVVNFAIIFWITRAVVCMLLNLSLATAIGTLNSIGGSKTKVRIIVMTVFGHLVASLVSFLGEDSIPICTLIISFFQAMVIFVGTTSE